MDGISYGPVCDEKQRGISYAHSPSYQALTESNRGREGGREGESVCMCVRERE